MIVLFVIDGLGVGGAERSLAETAPLLMGRGITPVVAFQHDRSPGVAPLLTAAGIELHHLSARSWLGRGVQLRRLIKDLHPDLVHATLLSSSFMARLARARTGIPSMSSLVNTTYTPPARLSRRGWRRTAIKTIDGLTARHLDAHFHAISRAVAEDATTNLRLDPGSVTVIPRGRTMSRLEPPPDAAGVVRHDLGVQIDAPLVISVGRQEPQKGQSVLVDAWPTIKAGHLDALLVIAGRRGAASIDIDAAIDDLSPPVQASIRRPGHLEDLGPLLSASDVFVFPSLWEGLGGALIEALGLGLPIVASDLPVFREFLSDGVNALLVPPGDSQQLARAVVSLLKDEGLRLRMTRANLQLFNERFTMDRVIDATVAMYRSVVAAQSSS